MTRDAAFYFANLGADVTRCVSAAKRGDESRYQESLERAYCTVNYIRASHRPEAYEEALLMLRGLALARATPETLASFQSSIDSFFGVSFP
jgi:hypothetical protein